MPSPLPRRSPAVVVVAMLAALLLVTGCASSGLSLRAVRSTASKPSNVAVYFTVDQADGTPVGGLEAKDFRIFEDGGRISEFESRQTILNPTVAASHYTLLLVDMSGSISRSGEAAAVVDAAGAFTSKLEKWQKVGVYAFDGSTDLYPVVPFTASGGAARGGVQSLSTFQPKDPSTNLNGAVVKGLALLEQELSHAEHPLRFGTLVVFTDGTDHAGRVSKDEMKRAVHDTRYDVFAIGLGAELSERELGEIGKTGTALAHDRSTVVAAFDQMAARIEGYTQRYYLLSYCTPARAGEHEVRIEAVVKSTEGKPDKTGSLRARFVADGFTPACDPSTPPRFDPSAGEGARAPDPHAPPPAKPAPPAPVPAAGRPGTGTRPTKRTAPPASAPTSPSTPPAPAAPPAAPEESTDYNP